ncbi:MAG: cytochrome c3 family protein [Desulfobacteraceae bacterium]|nr:cytochrome c3 family protein [Desulfobacteraceae bacterium]
MDRMKKNFSRVFCAVLMVALMGVVGAGQVSSEELCIPLGTITLSPPEDVESKRGDVEFPHDAHFNYSCKECHHTWEGSDKISGCSVSGCHDSSVPLLVTEPDKAYRYYKNAYHDMCINCHKEIQGSNEKLEFSRKSLDKPLPKTGPMGCVQCHAKK